MESKERRYCVENLFVLVPLEGKGKRKEREGRVLLEGQCSGVSWDHCGELTKSQVGRCCVGFVLGSGVEDKAQWLLGMVPHRSILGNCA